MHRRKFLMGASAALLATRRAIGAVAGGGKKGVMLMNRIAPSSSELHIAGLDGSNERRLLAESRFEYNACFSAHGDVLVFTSERNGDGQSDVFRAQSDGSDIHPLVTGSSMDDAGVLSPDGRRLAYVSTRNGYRANIWLLDLKSGKTRQLTGTPGVHGKEGKPDGYFRPSWSPDGKWLAFSSDRNTEWTGHDKGAGWEHTQELAST
jgi:Tol biopolymer transport system component